MKKPFQLISILLCMLIFTAACSNNESRDQSSGKETKARKAENVELTISAAASLKDAMEVIQRAYQEKQPDTSLTFNFGSSGALQQQISQGAPVDLFFSAAEDKFDYLVEEGLIAEEDGIDLLGNTLVLVVPKNASSIKSFEDLTKAKINNISVGTPETVPAGKYAKESLEKTEIWKEIESKIVFAKDVRQVLSYVETGNVDAGIVYKTDALISDKVEVIASADPTTHTPIIYPVGIIKNTKHYKEAKQFYDYLQSDEALKVFEEYGFAIK